MARFVTFTDVSQDEVGIDSKAVRVVERIDTTQYGPHTVIMMKDDWKIRVLESVADVVAVLNGASEI